MGKRVIHAGSGKSVGDESVAFGPIVRGDIHALEPFFKDLPAPRLREAHETVNRSTTSPRPRFKQADITRAINAINKAGQCVSGTEIAPDGTIRLLHGDNAEGGPSEYDRWKARRDARPS